MEKHVVCDNMLNGNIVSSLDAVKFHDPITNEKIEGPEEQSILAEFGQAFFIRISPYVQRAETNHYVFFKYDDELEDYMVWVEFKD